MAAPNIVGVTQIYGRTLGFALTNSNSDIVINPTSSNKVYKINSIYVSNVDGTANADVTISFYDASSTTSFKLMNTVVIPADTTLDVLSKSIYLEEGDKITGLASTNGDLEVIISYEEITNV